MNCSENGFSTPKRFCTVDSKPSILDYIPHFSGCGLDWWKLTNGIMYTTSHRVYQTGEGERGSKEAANDLGRLRIRLHV